MPLKSPCACRLSRRPPLTQLFALRLGLSQGAALQPEPLAMLRKALPFLRHVLRGRLTPGPQSLGLCWGPREAFPRALALQRALREALVARGPQPAATCLAAAACALVGGSGPARHGIALAQAGPRAPADRVAVQTTRLEGWRALGQPQHGVQRAPPLARDVGSAQGLRGRGVAAGGDVAEPGSAVAARLGGRRTRGQSRLEPVGPRGEARFSARGEQGATQAGPVLAPLGGLPTSPSQRWPAFARAQRAGVAHALGEDLLGCGLWRWAGVPRRWAVRGWGRGRCERTGPQAGHGQAAGVAGRRAGCLTEQGATLQAAAASARGAARWRRSGA